MCVCVCVLSQETRRWELGIHPHGGSSGRGWLREAGPDLGACTQPTSLSVPPMPPVDLQLGLDCGRSALESLGRAAPRNDCSCIVHLTLTCGEHRVQ